MPCGVASIRVPAVGASNRGGGGWRLGLAVEQAERSTPIELPHRERGLLTSFGGQEDLRRPRTDAAQRRQTQVHLGVGPVLRLDENERLVLDGVRER